MVSLAMESLAMESLAMESLAMESLAMETLAMVSLAMESLAMEWMGSFRDGKLSKFQAFEMSSFREKIPLNIIKTLIYHPIHIQT